MSDNKILLTSVVYLNFDIIKTHVDFLTAFNNDLDIVILENPSENTNTISNYCRTLINQGKISNYILFNQNITGNVFKVFFNNFNVHDYDYIYITDGDLTVDNVDFIQEQIGILKKYSDAFTCAVDLDLKNLPVKTFPKSINWHPMSKRVKFDCSEGNTGAFFLLFKTEMFYNFITHINNNNLAFIDSNMHKYCSSHKLKWLRTKKSKAYHYTWDLYNDINHKYTQLKMSSDNSLWNHCRTSMYKTYISNGQTQESPTVNVIILTFNQQNFIEQAVTSVLNQITNYTYNIIIGDDHSTDGTLDIIKDLAAKNKNIIYYTNEQNLGITKNLEKAFGYCDGEFVCFCEGDDYWCDNQKLETQTTFLLNNLDCSGCFHHFIIYDENSKKESTLNLPAHNTHKFNTQSIIEGIIASNFTTTMYRRSCLNNVSSSIFNVFSVDWAFNIALSEFGFIACLDKYLSVYRIHDSGYWSGSNNKQQLLLKALNDYDLVFQKKYTKLFKKLRTDNIINPKSKPLIALLGTKRGHCKKMLKTSIMNEQTQLFKSIKKPVKKARIKLNNNIINNKNNISKLINHTKINIGCGNKPFLGDWLNVDQNNRPLSISPDINYLSLNILTSFPFANAEIFYSEHFIEHLEKHDGISFIKNCYKSLNPNGVLRIATFDLDELINNCHSTNPDWKKDCMAEELGLGHMNRCEYLNAAFRSWGHQYIYNEEELKGIFVRGGFTNIKACDINKSDHPELCNRETRINSFLIIEGIK